MNLHDWKQLEETQEVMLEIKRRIEDATEALVAAAGVDPRTDAYLAGVIAAFKDILEIKIEETDGN